MLKLRLLTGPRAGRQLRISDMKPVSIGRRKGRLRLHDSRVSKNHAEIYFANDVWVLRDLGSANGTYVNRRKAKGLVELEPGDLVQMGRVLFKVVRCDMIGMDTQTLEPGQTGDDGFEEMLDDVEDLSASSQADDDIDLGQLLSDSDEGDRDDSADIDVDRVPPPVVEKKPKAAEPVAIDEPDDLVPESVPVDSEDADDDDDSFFADLGVLTDTTDGKDVGVTDASQDDTVQPDIESIDLEAPLKLKASDSSAAEVEVPVTAEDEEEDPFLPRGAEQASDDDSDLISLDDESGMGPRSHGTTLLTAAHDDGTPIGGAEDSDAASMDADDDDDEDDAEPPALVGLALEHAPPQQPLKKTQEQEPEEQEEDVAASVDADEPDEAELAEEPEIEAPGIDALPLDELAELDDDDEPLATAAAVDGPSLDEPEQDKDFDIDAAFDELSAGLDDSLSGAPAIDSDEPQQAQSQSEAPAEQSPAKSAKASELVDPLVGSQLDVGFIKDALSRLEKESDEAGPAEDASDGYKAVASVAEPIEAPATAPAPAASATIQSPPPGLTATGMNPTSVNPPAEPRRSYVAKGKGLGRWFFALLLLASLGVGGWLISENYDKLIGARANSSIEPGGAGLPDSPVIPNDALAGGDEPDTPKIDKPITSPYEDQPTEDDPTVSVRPGPDPFSAGPTVIGSDALEGLTRGSDDTRPLDPPRETTPDKVTGSDQIRQPDQPTIGNPNPGLDNPSNNEPPVGQVPKDPAVAQGKPARIVFLVDASGSLVDSLPQMLAWLNRALQTVDADEQFAIYFFKSDKPIAIKPQGMLKPSRNLLNQIAEDWLNANRMPVFPSGRSNPTEAIKQALTLEPTDLYLLSDDSFAFHQGDTTSSDALDLVKQAIGDADVRVHGVQFFYRSDQSILETLTNQYDGTFEFVRESVIPDEDPIDLLEELGNE